MKLFLAITYHIFVLETLCSLLKGFLRIALPASWLLHLDAKTGIPVTWHQQYPDSPEEYGDYFAWGETEPKGYYAWSTYKWCNGSNGSMTKYCTDGSYGYNGFTDGKTELDPEDDAAYVNWGPQWRMPTDDQLTELRNNCTWTWTTQNGVNGRLVTGPNGNSIFLPAAGYRWYENLRNAGSWGHYWSRTLRPAYSYYYAYNLYCDSGYVCWNGAYGCDFGFSVRAVRVP